MMNLFEPTATGQTTDWLIFIVMLLAIGIGIASFLIWFTYLHKSGKKKSKRSKRRHHRPTNTTLAQLGGLPPKREPDQPPHGL